MKVISTINASRVIVSSNIPVTLYAPSKTIISALRLQLQPNDTVPLNIGEIEIISGKL